MNKLSIWVRVIRVRLLSASLVAVTTGLAISWSAFHVLNIPYALLTYAGVLSLHASVDILNDYFDYKNKIDLMTKGTPFSGGTRVLPDGLLEPRSVYRMGMFFLIAGALIGVFFTIATGPIVGAILLFAVLSTYFYSTSVVSSGLGEIFLVIKGTLIVLGSFYVQVRLVQFTPVYVGLILGILSSAVVFANEFPDYAADKAGGRKNIVVVMGIQNAAKFYAFYPILAVSLGVLGVTFRIIPWEALIGIAISIPLFVRAFFTLRSNRAFHDSSDYVPALADNVLGARILGVALAISFVIAGLGLL
jgi:1,4-dihydroxy-2-naphthoate octaprenyltransferase